MKFIENGYMMTSIITMAAKDLAELSSDVGLIKEEGRYTFKIRILKGAIFLRGRVQF